MTNRFDIKRFTQNEDGSLLVFFLISIFSILGVFALSFDMGRRAATQTDMQSFADNVALAAAGELDGSPDAITNARAAATSVIIAANEQLKQGTGVAAGGLTITFDATTDLIFYTDLPERDRPSTYDPALLGDSTNAAYKYRLPTTDTTTDPAEARFVGVRLDTRNVDWLFAGAVTNNAPAAAVGAIAIAGNAGYTCEIAPVMVCLPRDNAGNVVTLNEGISIQLQTVGNGAAWNPGQFGYLDVSSIPDSVASTCAGETPESRFQACLLAKGISACFNDRGVDIQTGQRGGQEPAGFNLPFGIFGQAMNQLRSDAAYAVGPHTISGQTMNNSCRANGDTMESGVNDTYPFVGATMAFPMDTCHPDCTTTSGYERYGNGNWDRDLYNDVNYTIVDPNDPSIVLFDGSDFFDFPQSGLTRYEYYQLEIERAANGGLMTGPNYSGTKYSSNGQNDNYNINQVATFDQWDDFWRDLGGPSDPAFNPIIPDAREVDFDNGLPSCVGNGANSLSVTNNIDRRVIVFAGIDCPPAGDPDRLTGDEEDVPVEQYYEAFLLGPARDSSGNSETYTGNGNGNNTQQPIFELYVEVIEAIGGEGGGSTASSSAFREMVQLYR